jgi:hypothetical protein
MQTVLDAAVRFVIELGDLMRADPKAPWTHFDYGILARLNALSQIVFLGTRSIMVPGHSGRASALLTLWRLSQSFRQRERGAAWSLTWILIAKRYHHNHELDIDFAAMPASVVSKMTKAT